MSTRHKLTRAASVRSQSFDPDTNTIDLVWSTGACVRRFDPWSGEEFDEVLSLEPGDVRLGRLNAGAPFLDTHDSTELAKVIGSVVPGSAAIENGRGVCTVQLSRAAADRDVVGKITDGIIRNVSVGYWTYAESKTEGPNGIEVRTATDWEPLEISAVAIPADAGAQIRSASGGRSADRARAAEIRSRGERAGYPNLARKHVRLGTSVERFVDILLGRLAKRQKAAEAAKRENSMSKDERDYQAGAAMARKFFQGGTDTPERREDRRKDELLDSLAEQAKGERHMRELIKKTGVTFGR